MPKKVTMDTIAKKLGISKNTVSLALRGMSGISEATRKAIEDTAISMGYQYKSNAVKASNTRNLCLVIAKSTRDSIGFFSYIQLGIEDEARRNNLNTIIHYYDENDEVFGMPNCIKEGMISGIITLGRNSPKTIKSINSYNLPVIMVDNYFDNLPMDCILTDNHCGGYLATEYLIECGHTKIGFIGDVSLSVSFYDRYQGYTKALKEYNLEMNEGYSVLDKGLGNLSSEEVEKIISEVKSKEGLPTAYVCCNDAQAIVTMKAMKNMNISIPNKVSIIGFDDIETARNMTPELTTMKVEKELMGKIAVRKLLERIDGGTGIPQKVLLSASLVKRESVKQLISHNNS
ncbi:LacI family DNA-binding transcriptional regulator [Ruminiclostridium herbifermentans]|uniref:LacI family DNA-binding transcriptional regulator n=1 Tax=Ruminiclostridium herbifermentans TaxID=2488810 RepID=A0A4U7JFA0_9FIRM|nr:LacI family DNA-binding transcriptional regulator [Ruminiclostridium herbifermentans]QNU67452.1 LacI family DNA-binding transcriptional regulator [Ruminiclostridium herbifermentans]